MTEREISDYIQGFRTLLENEPLPIHRISWQHAIDIGIELLDARDDINRTIENGDY